MRKPSRMEHLTRLLVATLLSLSMVFLLSTVAQALDCTACHGVTGYDAAPVDTPAGSLPTYRNISTGAVKGNHNTHSDPSTSALVCTRCHGTDAASYNTRHAILNNYSIRMSPTVKYNKYTSAAAFSLHTTSVISFAQTPISQLGKCSTANCHFEARTPVWGSDPLSGANLNTCSVCHNALPETGSHSLHIAEHGSNLNACTLCHSDHTSEARPFQHATSVGRAITVKSFLGYSGNGSNNLYLPSQNNENNDRTFGFCSTAYCHDDGLGNGAASKVETPIWGESVIRCSACHPQVPITGSHTLHLHGSTHAVCASCHNGAVQGSSVPAQHNDGNVDVYKLIPGDLGYLSDKEKGTSYSTCSTAACHVDPSSVSGVGGGALQKTSPTWGNPPEAKCSYCHVSRPVTGSHQAHYDAGFALCSNCHNGALEGTTLSASHDNNLIDVYKTTPGDFGYPSAKAIGSAYGTCTTGICHDNGRGNAVTSPVWGTATTNCTACHKGTDATPTIPNTGSHVQHITGVGVTCGNCHMGAVQGTTAPLLHMNGLVDVYKTTPGDFGGGYPAAGKAKGSDFASCTTASCHGRLSPVWGGNTPNYQCTKCHGMGVTLANYSTSTFEQSAPGYMGVGIGVGRQTGIVNGNVSSDPKVGAHDTHMRSLNSLGKPTACSDCHTVPATAFVSGHMDGSSAPTWSKMVQNIETIPGSARPYTYKLDSVVPGYDSSNGTCSNTYCHGAKLPGGNDKSPRWNDGTYLNGDRTHDCSQCHGYPPETSARKAHTPPEYFMTCTNCHPHNGARAATGITADGGAVGYDYHVNGNLEALGFCDSCHDYDTRGAAGLLWGKNQIAVEGYGAHAMHINYLKKRMNVTTMNSNEDIYGTGNFNGICGVCHSRNIADHTQTNRATSTRNINFGDDDHRAARQFGPNPPQYNGATGVSSGTTKKTCSNIDCHFKTSPIWQPF